MAKVILPPPRHAGAAAWGRPQWREKIRRGTALVRDGLADAVRALWHDGKHHLATLRQRGALIGSRIETLSRTLAPKLARRLHL